MSSCILGLLFEIHPEFAASWAKSGVVDTLILGKSEEVFESPGECKKGPILPAPLLYLTALVLLWFELIC